MNKGFGKNLIVFVIALALLVVAGTFVFMNQRKAKESITEGVLSPQQIAEKAINFLNQNKQRFGLPEGITASLINVVEEDGVYKIHLKIGEEEYDSYVTKGGKLLFPQAIDLEEAPIAQASGAETSQPSSENTVSPEELTEFILCLKEANFVIYGANWCGWTQKLVEMLGGFDILKPIYVECTEEQESCGEKGIGGYPTILVKGEEYQGARSFEEIAAATDCEVPSGAEFISGETSGGGGCQ